MYLWWFMRSHRHFLSLLWCIYWSTLGHVVSTWHTKASQQCAVVRCGYFLFWTLMCVCAKVQTTFPHNPLWDTKCPLYKHLQAPYFQTGFKHFKVIFHCLISLWYTFVLHIKGLICNACNVKLFPFMIIAVSTAQFSNLYLNNCIFFPYSTL